MLQDSSKSKFLIYQTKSGKTKIDVRFEDETVWLTQAQLADLFQTTSQNITQHIKNIYKEKEVAEKATCKDFLQVQSEGKRQVQRNTKYYNLDMIIPIGYRIKSHIATRFRQWSTGLIKQHLVQGYTINENRLKLAEYKYQEMQKTISLLNTTIAESNMGDEGKGLVQVITEYTRALNILDNYDHEKLTIPKEASIKKYDFILTYDKAKEIMKAMKQKFNDSDLVGKEKDESFKSSISTIYQTFGGKDVYPSVEEKAAHLLYFVIKNHSFIDGNKRIAAALFIYFLEQNKILFKDNGDKHIDNNSLVALTLMTASSKREEKDLIIKVIVNLLL
ncbi:MAG: virulence protein RhuM/Fic/DOC family protein [bacterium]|nr:virulence protein RhuM/Fic/DOC family protein [bacterium]